MRRRCSGSGKAKTSSPLVGGVASAPLPECLPRLSPKDRRRGTPPPRPPSHKGRGDRVRNPAARFPPSRLARSGDGLPLRPLLVGVEACLQIGPEMAPALHQAAPRRAGAAPRSAAQRIVGRRRGQQASARHAASSAAFVTPAPTCGRTTNAASPRQHRHGRTRRRRAIPGRRSVAETAASVVAHHAPRTSGARVSAAAMRIAATTSARISGGGDRLRVDACPAASVSRSGQGIRPRPPGDTTRSCSGGARAADRCPSPATGIAQHLLAGRQAEAESAEQRRVSLGWHVRLVQQPTPGHITRIGRSHIAPHGLPHRGPHAIGPDQQRTVHGPAIREPHPHPARHRRSHPANSAPERVASVRQGAAQHPEQPVPGRHHLRAGVGARPRRRPAPPSPAPPPPRRNPGAGPGRAVGGYAKAADG